MIWRRQALGLRRKSQEIHDSGETSTRSEAEILPRATTRSGARNYSLISFSPARARPRPPARPLAGDPPTLPVSVAKPW